MTRAERLATRAVVFLSGAMLMATEIAAFRIIGKSFGSALRETTAVIAVFLAAMSIGYWAGGRAGDRWPRAATLVTALLCAAASLFAIPWLDAIASMVIARSTLPIALHAFVATTVIFAIPAGFFAATSPIAIRLFMRSADESGSTAGSISALSTAGSIAGSIGTAFFLLEWLESINRTVMFIGVAATITAIILFVASMRRFPLESVAAAAAVALALFLFVYSTHIDATLLREAPGWRLLFVGDSPYHHITVRENHSRHRFLSFGLGEQTVMDVADPYGAGAIYTSAFHIGRLIHSNLRRVLIIGLGGGTAAKQFTRDYSDVTIDAVEVDPMVVSVAKRFFYVQPGDRLRIYTEDGRAFLRQTNDRWDLIIVDAYTTNRYGATIPPHLVSREFFQEAAGHLNPGGILHFHCAFEGSKILPALQNTMASVFASTLVSNGEILGSDTKMVPPSLAAAMQSPAERLPQFVAYVTALHEPRSTAGAPVLTDDYAPVDALLRSR